MKKIFSICTIVSLNAMLITGCSKGGGSSISPPSPTPPAAPTLSVTATPDTIWYAKTSVINWSSTNATSVSLAGGSISGTSGSFTTPILITPTNYSFTATGPGGSVTNTKQAYVCSQFLTFLCWDETLNRYALWANTTTMQSTNGGPWVPSVIDPVKWTYFPDSSRKGTFPSGQTGMSHYQISYVGSDTYINLGETYNPPNKYKIESLNATTFVLSKYSTDGTVLFMITYTKIP